MLGLQDSDIEKLHQAGWNKYYIEILEEYIEARTKVVVLNIEVAWKFADGRPQILERLARMISLVEPGSPDITILYAAIHHKKSGKGSDRNGPGRGNAPVYSIPLEEVPRAYRDKIMCEDVSHNVHVMLLERLREIFGAARRAGVEESLNAAAFAAFGREVHGRELTPSTVAKKMKDAKRLAKLFELDASLIEPIHNELMAARRRISKEPRVRHVAFRANPVAPWDYAIQAVEASHEARQPGLRRPSRHKLITTAALLAVYTVSAERISDLLGLVVGKSAQRDEEGWLLDFITQKGARHRSALRLPPEVTPYLDDLILLGASPGVDGSVLTKLYRERAAIGSPLFARSNWKNAYGNVSVYTFFKERTGHGPHASRKAMADHLAAAGLGEEHVLEILGHQDIQVSRDAYEMFADRARRARTHEALSEAQKERAKYGSIRTPAGQLVDPARIAARLARHHSSSKRKG